MFEAIGVVGERMFVGGGSIDAPDDENKENMPATLKAACDYVRADNMNIERKHFTKQLNAIPDYTCRPLHNEAWLLKIM